MSFYSNTETNDYSMISSTSTSYARGKISSAVGSGASGKIGGIYNAKLGGKISSTMGGSSSMGGKFGGKMEGDMSDMGEYFGGEMESDMSENFGVEMGSDTSGIGGNIAGKMESYMNSMTGKFGGQMGSDMSGKGKYSGKMGGKYGGKMESNMGGKMSGKYSGKMGGKYGGKTESGVSGKMSRNFSDKVDSDMGGKMTGKYSGKMGGKYSGKMESNMSGKMTGKYSGKMGGKYGGKMESNMSGKMTGKYSGKMGGKYGGKMESNMGGKIGGKYGGKMESNMSGKMGGKYGGKMENNMGGKFMSGKIGKRMPDDDFEISVELDKIIQEAEVLSAAGVGGKIDAQTFHDSVNMIDEEPFELTFPSEQETTEELDSLIKEVESLPLDNEIVSSLTSSLSEICELEAKKGTIAEKAPNKSTMVVVRKGKTAVVDSKAKDSYELRIDSTGGYHIGKGYLHLLDKLESSEVEDTSYEVNTPMPSANKNLASTEVDTTSASIILSPTEVDPPGPSASKNLAFTEANVPISTASKNLIFTEANVPISTASTNLTYTEANVPISTASKNLTYMEANVPISTASKNLAYKEANVPISTASKNLTYTEANVPILTASKNLTFTEANVPISTASKKLIFTKVDAFDSSANETLTTTTEGTEEPKIIIKILKQSLPETPVKQVVPKFDTSVKHRFKCINCPHSYPEQRQLDFHLLMIHGIKKYQCYKCNYETSSKKWLETHVLEDHLKRQVFRCSICKVQVPNLQFLESHLKETHKIKKVFKCLICCKIFKTLSALVNHENFIHKAKGYAPKSNPNFIMFPCHKCKKVFTREGNLISHLRSHKRRIKLKCEFDECKQLRFYSKLTYIKHIKEIHKSKACRNCLKALKSNALFVYHLSVDSECFQYYETISNPGAKKKKDKNIINDDEAEYNDLLKNMPFIPNLSEQIEIDHEFLKSIGEDTEIKDTDDTEVVVNTPKRIKIEELKCNDCNIKFREELTFGKHMTLVHNNLECYRCSKKFDCKQKILEHINVHYLDVKYDYRCKKCSKCFRYRSNLTLHESKDDCTKPKVKPVTLPPVTGVHKGHLFHGPPSLCL